MKIGDKDFDCIKCKSCKNLFFVIAGSRGFNNTHTCPYCRYAQTDEERKLKQIQELEELLCDLSSLCGVLLNLNDNRQSYNRFLAQYNKIRELVRTI